MADFIRAGQINETSPWQNLTEGLSIYEPSTSKSVLTGEWRTVTPEFDEEKCKQCLICVPVCPDSAIPVANKKRLDFDYDHCKGCGICVRVCPFDAIHMEGLD